MQKKLFFCFAYGNLTEFLKIFHELEGSLAGAGAGGLVTFNYLSLSVGLEDLDVGVNFFNKCFHKKRILKVFGKKVSSILLQYRK